MYNTQIVKNNNISMMKGQYSAVPVTTNSLNNTRMMKGQYSAVPVTTNSHINHNNSHTNRSDVVALFMGDCSTTSGSCVQSRLLGPSDTYSVTSSQQSYLMSDSSSYTTSSYSHWIPPPYTPVDSNKLYHNYVNVPASKQMAVQVKTIQRTSRKSVWLGLIFGFSIFLLLVLGAVFAYGLDKGVF